MTAGALPLARSDLFVPGNRPERIDKALASGADRVVLDLEDAMAPADKPAARAMVAAARQGCDDGARRRLVVRINDAAASWFDDDLAMLAATGASAVMLPKADNVQPVLLLRQA